MWHDAGPLLNSRKGLQPCKHFENAETKRRLHNLVGASGLLDSLHQIKPRPATDSELQRAHSEQYINHIRSLSNDSSKAIHRAGDELSFAPGAFEIAALAAGGAIELTDAVLSGKIRNGYALIRPPGHHAERDRGMGFCIFNNVAAAAAHAMHKHGLQRIAVVDFDVHHGNGTQQIFWEDDRLMLISIHQDSNYPLNSGGILEVGAGAGEGYNINIPLPPGSGGGAYRAAFDRVILPALEAYQPQLILVSAGYDGSFMDPLASMMLSSEDYRYFAKVLCQAAEEHCHGRLVAMHEGGYSDFYVPFCGLAFIEEMAGVSTGQKDPVLTDVENWGYQALQSWQDGIIKSVQEGPLTLLRLKLTVLEPRYVIITWCPVCNPYRRKGYWTRHSLPLTSPGRHGYYTKSHDYRVNTLLALVTYWLHQSALVTVLMTSPLMSDMASYAKHG
eukprot:jgi/Chrzof1/4217/Cz14g03140.t1